MNDESRANDSFSQYMGIGLRSPYYSQVLSELPKVGWFEVITENFFGLKGKGFGRALQTLEKIRSHYPIVLHGVSLNLGSTDPLNQDYLNRWKELITRIEPSWVSDHLCWGGVGGQNLHDLLPLPYTEETVDHVVSKIKRVQDFLGTRLSVENVSSYLTFTHSEMEEWEFLTEISERADCGILLDVNNIYVSSQNHGFDPESFLEGIPISRVTQFHLAGHSDMGTYLFDTHDAPVIEPVWELYKKASLRFGAIPTLLERDDKFPEFSELFAEAQRATRIQKEIYGGASTQGARAVAP